MNAVLPAVAAGLLLGAGILAVLRTRGATMGGQIFWLVCFLAFAVAGVAAVLRLFVPGVGPVYVTLMAFAMSVGLVAALLAAACHLVRPVPEKWVTAVLAIPVVVYVVAVLTDQLYYTGLIQIVALIGLTGLAAWKFEQASRTAMWLIAAAIAFALLPAVLMRTLPGIAPQDAGHVAAALGVLALLQASQSPGNPRLRGTV